MKYKFAEYQACKIIKEKMKDHGFQFAVYTSNENYIAAGIELRKFKALFHGYKKLLLKRIRR
jgi:hypothetical protein